MHFVISKIYFFSSVLAGVFFFFKQNQIPIDPATINNKKITPPITIPAIAPPLKFDDEVKEIPLVDVENVELILMEDDAYVVKEDDIDCIQSKYVLTLVRECA